MTKRRSQKTLPSALKVTTRSSAPASTSNTSSARTTPSPVIRYKVASRPRYSVSVPSSTVYRGSGSSPAPWTLALLTTAPSRSRVQPPKPEATSTSGATGAPIWSSPLAWLNSMTALRAPSGVEQVITCSAVYAASLLSSSSSSRSAANAAEAGSSTSTAARAIARLTRGCPPGPGRPPWPARMQDRAKHAPRSGCSTPRG